MVEIYRLKMAMKNGGASWAEFKYFENADDFREALLLAMLSEMSHDYRVLPRLSWRAAGVWLRDMEGNDESKPEIDRVFAAEKLVDGEWIEIKAHVEPPKLVFNE